MQEGVLPRCIEGDVDSWDLQESHVVPSLTQKAAVEESQRHSWMLLESAPWATSSCAALNAALEARADDKG